MLSDFSQFLTDQGGQGQQLQNWEVVFSLLLSWGLLTIVCLVYRYTHRTPGYSQSYVHTLILTGMVTTLIMIVIGSNIARAFSLVGALSIIRFRNAIKETRDIGFIFFAMAIAMACGTRFYITGTIACGLIGSVNLLLHFTNFAAMNRPPERLLTVCTPPGVDPETLLEQSMKRLFQSFSIVSMESVRQGLYTEVVFSVQPMEGISGNMVLDEISKANGNLKISYNYSDHADFL